MVVTVVLRLLPDPLANGDLVGHAEYVSTGLTGPVRGLEDIVAFCRQAVDGATLGPPTSPHEGVAAEDSEAP